MRRRPNPIMRMRHYPPELALATAMGNMVAIHDMFDAFRVQSLDAMRNLSAIGLDRVLLLRSIAAQTEEALYVIGEAYALARDGESNPDSDKLMDDALGRLGQILSDCINQPTCSSQANDSPPSPAAT